jgi:hypothetical protein
VDNTLFSGANPERCGRRRLSKFLAGDYKIIMANPEYQGGILDANIKAITLMGGAPSAASNGAPHLTRRHAPVAPEALVAPAVTVGPQGFEDQVVPTQAPKSEATADSGSADQYAAGAPVPVARGGKSHEGRRRRGGRWAGCAVAGTIALAGAMGAIGSLGNTDRANAAPVATESATGTATPNNTPITSTPGIGKVGGAATTETATATATQTATETATATATATKTAKARATATETATATATATETATPGTGSVGQGLKPSATPNASPTPNASATPEASATPTAEEQALEDAKAKLKQDLKLAAKAKDPAAVKATEEAIDSDIDGLTDAIVASVDANAGQTGAGSGYQSATGGAQAPAATAAPSATVTPTPTAKEKRAKMLDHADDAKTVGGMMRRLQSTKENFRANLKAIAYKFGPKDVLHSGHAVGSFRNAFEKDEVGPMNCGEGVIGNIKGDDGNAIAYYNIKHNRPTNAALPEGKSVEDARQEVLKQLTAEGVTFTIKTNWNGEKRMNHMSLRDKIVNAGLLTLKDGDRVCVVKDENGKKLYEVKLFGPKFNCGNPLTEVEEAPVFVIQQTTPGGKVVVTTPAPSGGTRTTPPATGTTPSPVTHSPSGHGRTTTPTIPPVVNVKPTPTPTPTPTSTPPDTVKHPEAPAGGHGNPAPGVPSGGTELPPAPAPAATVKPLETPVATATPAATEAAHATPDASGTPATTGGDATKDTGPPNNIGFVIAVPALMGAARAARRRKGLKDVNFKSLETSGR